MSKAPLNEENAVVTERAEKEATLLAENGVAETATDEKENAKNKKRLKRKGKKIPENETEEQRKEREKKEEAKKKKKPKDIKTATKRLLAYLSPYKVHLVLVAILVVLSTVISVLTTLMLQPVYSALEQFCVKKTITGEEAFSTISKWLIAAAIGYAVSALFNLLYSRIMLYVSSKTLANMRRELFNHIQSLPLEYFDKRKTGQIMSHFTNDVGRINDLVSNNFPTLISSVIQAVMTITIMVVISWKLTLTLTVAIVLMFASVMFITSKCSPLFKAQQKAIGEVNGFTEEYIKGIKNVQLFCQEEQTKAKFAELNENYRKIGVKANVIGGFMGPMMSMITRVNYAIVVILGASIVLTGRMDVAKLITYINFSKSYGTPIMQVASCYSSLISALAGAERVFEVLDTPSETDEGQVRLVRLIKNALGETEETDSEKGEGELHWKVPTEDGCNYVPVRGDIRVKDVTFAYVEGTDVLKNINVTAKSGQKVAFVGSTGAGKTTITNLINRFYEIEQGEIIYDGIPIKDIKKADLRRSMAMVLQDTKLFVGTIAENIRYGKLDATMDEVIAAAKVSNAHAFIEQLPDGYETEIRSDAANISTGQAQLINIARAAITGAPLLILDEATSSVDTRTERLIEVAMDNIMESRTVFVIAHRLSTVRNSQDIIVLENGEIIEEGDHQTLIDLGGKYYQLYTGAFEMK